MATLLVDTGKAIVTNRLGGSGTEPLYIGVGTGAGTTGAANTSLFTEANTTYGATGSRVTGTSSQVTTSVTDDTYQVTGTFTSGGANTITNAGLFDNATIGSGSLFLKGDFTGIGLADGDSIAFTFKVQFS